MTDSRNIKCEQLLMRMTKETIIHLQKQFMLNSAADAGATTKAKVEPNKVGIQSEIEDLNSLENAFL